MLLALDLGQVTCLTVTILFCCSIYRVVTRKTTAYDVLPWAGLPHGPLARLRGYLFSGGGRDRLLKAYKEVRMGFKLYTEKVLTITGKHSLQGRCFIWQGLRQTPVVVLPPSQTSFILEQPESVLCNRTFFQDRQHTRSSLAEGLPCDPIHVDIIRKDLTRHLDDFLLPASDEIEATLKEHLGSDGQWHSIRLREVMADVAIRVFNRSFAGEELARNEDLKHHVSSFANVAMGSASLLHVCPAFLRPLFGFFVLRPNRHHWKAIASHILPIIESRKAAIGRHASEMHRRPDQPHDALQSLICASLDSHNPTNALSTTICTRYIFTAVASVRATALAATQTIFYLARTPPALRAIEVLRREIAHVRDGYCPDGHWTQTTLARLVYMDSAIRETLRIGVRSETTASRTVVAPAGVMLNDGTLLPPGTHVALHVLGAHFLNRRYTDPHTYNPWRFVQPDDAARSGFTMGPVGKDNISSLQPPPRASARTAAGTASTTGAEFLTWGIGRHSCPGRFFVVAELKLILIELLMRYDVQPLEQQPPVESIGGTETPRFDATLMVRKPPGESI